MSDRSANIDVTPYMGNKRDKQIEVTLDDLEEALKVTNWKWHEIEDEDEATQEKVSYSTMRSVYDALLAKHFRDKAMLLKIKQLHNEHAPDWYDIP